MGVLCVLYGSFDILLYTCLLSACIYFVHTMESFGGAYWRLLACVSVVHSCCDLAAFTKLSKIVISRRRAVLKPEVQSDKESRPRIYGSHACDAKGIICVDSLR